ncbi:MAG TPA: hypothetical protein PKI14_01075 [Fervidobacterium sp.]|jgi:hypothetical protein|nr:hypothetical protein [Fervidobacterium sp.]
MKVQKIRLRTGRGIPESISNLWYQNECDISQFEDAVFDSKDAQELMLRINSLNLLRKFTLDRATETKIRLKSVDNLGNISFLEFYK